MFQASALFKKNYTSPSFIVVNQGGTSSGKTYAILQCIFAIIISSKERIVATVVGQDIPNLKAGALRDCIEIIRCSASILNFVSSYNKTDRIFIFKNGSELEFKSYEDAQDAKSGKRDILFVNEANGISYDVYKQLELRTYNKIYLDYNPSSRFWVHDKLIGKEGVELIISDHRHNPFLSNYTRDKIEALKEEDEELWKVYARGLTGTLRETIYSKYKIVDEVPEHAKLVAIGLDFGFTNSQTAAIAVYLQNGELYVDEVIYRSGLLNTEISSLVIQAGFSKKTIIVADCAEPKSIEELRRLGHYVEESKKGADSTRIGIDILKRYIINITRRSTNIKREIESYKFSKDKNGNVLNEPVKALDHAMDAIRYVALNKLNIKNVGNGRTGVA